MRIPPDDPPPPPAGTPAPEKLHLGVPPGFERVNAPTRTHRDIDVNDVRAHLLAAAGSVPERSLDAGPPRSRRTRDFLILLTLGNATIGTLMSVVGLNPVTLIFGFAGIVVFTTGLTWVVYGIMDNY